MHRTKFNLFNWHVQEPLTPTVVTDLETPLVILTTLCAHSLNGYFNVIVPSVSVLLFLFPEQ